MDKKISQLITASTPLTGAEELAIVQSGVTKKTTIEDVKGYKVYTALLTQSGNDTIPAIINSSPLTIGVTYEIVDNTGINVTNVGSPNNNVGTKFVATGTTPSSWGSGSLSYMSSAPVVTVLENTIGNIWWTYENLGVYSANALNAFTNNKTAVNISSTVKYGGDNAKLLSWITADSTDSKVLIQTQDANYDDILDNTPIEIRVYN